MTGVAADATRPPSGLPELDPAWSRLVSVTDGDGITRTWHVLDNGVEPSAGTMLCVHGNPTWSYLWRRFIAAAPPGWRVVAVDQLGMGYSERTEQPRGLEQRIDDLSGVADALDVTGPTVLVAHDWGGIVGLGWALRQSAQLRGIVLTNTGVALPDGKLPPLLRVARTPALRTALTVGTPAFVRAAAALSRPSLRPSVRAALAAPYATAARRAAVGHFVADIPFEADHPSALALARIVAGLPNLASVPGLLLWGARDPVFSLDFLDDLHARLPHADVQRYAQASHLVTEDAPQTATDAWRWIASLEDRTDDSATRPPTSPDIGAALRQRRTSDELAMIELGGPGGGPRRTTWKGLHRQVEQIAAGLDAVGVKPGHRVAVLVRPGVQLTAVVYACWQLGAVIVVADAGLGLRALRGALRSAAPDHVVAIPAALMAMAALRLPGQRILAGSLPAALRRRLRVRARLDDFTVGAVPPPVESDGDPEAAVLFTSGATGPPKGVVYRRSQLVRQIELVRQVMGIGPDDRLVTAFAPFALYGPAMGVPAASPDMDVTRPGTLTATTLAEAVAAIDGTVLFASPAALRNVVATAHELPDRLRPALRGLRRVISAGAPVPVGLLQQVQELAPEAELHTPYGMTEALPITDVSLPQLVEAGRGNGVCVGRALPDVDVSVSALDHDGAATGALSRQPYLTGEICVSAAHVKDRYDRLWATQADSARDPGFHRTGDVGHLDDQGRLWVEGRLVHVITTAAGPVTPVGIEQRLEELDAIRTAAVVGVGPAGTQQVVAVVVPSEAPAQVLADDELAASARAAVSTTLTAVLTVPTLPVDIRHDSKINRTALAEWADTVLRGARPPRVPRR